VLEQQQQQRLQQRLQPHLPPSPAPRPIRERSQSFDSASSGEWRRSQDKKGSAPAGAAEEPRTRSLDGARCGAAGGPAAQQELRVVRRAGRSLELWRTRPLRLSLQSPRSLFTARGEGSTQQPQARGAPEAQGPACAAQGFVPSTTSPPHSQPPKPQRAQPVSMPPPSSSGSSSCQSSGSAPSSPSPMRTVLPSPCDQPCDGGEQQHCRVYHPSLRRKLSCPHIRRDISLYMHTQGTTTPPLAHPPSSRTHPLPTFLAGAPQLLAAAPPRTVAEAINRQLAPSVAASAELSTSTARMSESCRAGSSEAGSIGAEVSRAGGLAAKEGELPMQSEASAAAKPPLSVPSARLLSGATQLRGSASSQERRSAASVRVYASNSSSMRRASGTGEGGEESRRLSGGSMQQRHIRWGGPLVLERPFSQPRTARASAPGEIQDGLAGSLQQGARCA